MARTCELCGKGANTANHVSHAQNKVKRRQKSNLQSAIVKDPQGKMIRVKKVCTTCRRTLVKQN